MEEDKTVYRIRLPREQPIRLLIEPEPRQGSKQLTCIRYDEHGQYFVDEFIERSSMHQIFKTDRRYMTHVRCPKFSMEASLAICHRYCSTPCPTHLAAIAEHGWYNDGSAPTMREQEGQDQPAKRKDIKRK